VVRNVARHPSKTNPSMPPSPTRPPREVGPDPGRKPRGDAAGPHPKYVDDRPVGGAIEGAGFEILESSSGEGAPEPDEAYIRLQVRKRMPKIFTEAPRTGRRSGGRRRKLRLL